MSEELVGVVVLCEMCGGVATGVVHLDCGDGEVELVPLCLPCRPRWLAALEEWAGGEGMLVGVNVLPAGRQVH